MLDSGAPVRELVTLGFGDSTFALRRAARHLLVGRGPRGGTGRDRVPGAGPQLPQRARRPRARRTARRCRRDRGPARRRRRHRRRGVDRSHAAAGRPGDRSVSRSCAPRPCSSSGASGRRAARTSRSSCVASRVSWSPGATCMLDYDVPATYVDQACAITPGIESPTVSPLQRDGLVRGARHGAARARLSRSWTGSTTSVRAESSSPPSTPAGSESATGGVNASVRGVVAHEQHVGVETTLRPRVTGRSRLVHEQQDRVPVTVEAHLAHMLGVARCLALPSTPGGSGSSTSPGASPGSAAGLRRSSRRASAPGVSGRPAR